MSESNTRAWFSGICFGVTPLDARNQRRFLAYCLSWAVAFGAATFALKGDRLPVGALRWLVAGAPSLDLNDPLLVMLVVWAVAQTVIERRYR